LLASDFTSALAQLLVNPALRNTFSSNPRTAADLLNVVDSDRSMFVSLCVAQIERQAGLLITKRMRETFLLLPLTAKVLGSKAAAYFSEYAVEYWPDTHRRHATDALNFCQYLRRRRLPFNQSEYNRVRFNNARQRFRVCFVKDALIDGKRHYAFQVLYRLSRYQGEWRIYFKA
jgi:hypothetical protein